MYVFKRSDEIRPGHRAPVCSCHGVFSASSGCERQTNGLPGSVDPGADSLMVSYLRVYNRIKNINAGQGAQQNHFQ